MEDAVQIDKSQWFLAIERPEMPDSVQQYDKAMEA